MPRYYYSLITVSAPASAVSPITIVVGPSEEMTELGRYRNKFVRLLEDLKRSDLMVSELLGVHSVPPPPAPQEIPAEIMGRRSVTTFLKPDTAEVLAKFVNDRLQVVECGVD